MITFENDNQPARIMPVVEDVIESKTEYEIQHNDGHGLPMRGATFKPPDGFNGRFGLTEAIRHRLDVVAGLNSYNRLNRPEARELTEKDFSIIRVDIRKVRLIV